MAACERARTKRAALRSDGTTGETDEQHAPCAVGSDVATSHER